jgi:hypothetical protein
MKTTFKVGDKIKTFEVKSIVKGLGKTYDEKGNKTIYETEYMLLLSDKGQERVLEVGKTSLNDCLTWTTTFGSKHKFIIWNQL